MTRRFAQGALLGIILGFSILGTAAVALPQVPPETVDQVRISQLEQVTGRMNDHETRLIHLEDRAAAAEANQDEMKWWERFIGSALILAVIERILRSAGVLTGKSESMGPVG